MSIVPGFGEAGGVVEGSRRVGAGDPEGDSADDPSDGVGDDGGVGEDEVGEPDEHPASAASASAPIARYRAIMPSR
jgi:hypothetical protein